MMTTGPPGTSAPTPVLKEAIYADGLLQPYRGGEVSSGRGKQLRWRTSRTNGDLTKPANALILQSQVDGIGRSMGVGFAERDRSNGLSADGVIRNLPPLGKRDVPILALTSYIVKRWHCDQRFACSPLLAYCGLTH